MSEKIRNAIIEKVSIDNGERGLLTAWLHFDYGDGSHQGFGGYALYLPKDFTHHKVNEGYAGHFLYRCMEIAGVEAWDKITGKSVRVKFSDEGAGFSSKILAIGHITKNDWFNPSEDFKK